MALASLLNGIRLALGVARQYWTGEAHAEARRESARREVGGTLAQIFGDVLDWSRRVTALRNELESGDWKQVEFAFYILGVPECAESSIESEFCSPASIDRCVKSLMTLGEDGEHLVNARILASEITAARPDKTSDIEEQFERLKKMDVLLRVAATGLGKIRQKSFRVD